MSDKSVYKWSAFCGSDFMPLGGQKNGKHVNNVVFMKGADIDTAYKRWKSDKGMTSVLNGTHENKALIEEVKRTLEWYKTRHTLYYASDIKKEELEEMETIKLSAQIPFGSQKVLDVLDAVCPHDYEAFPIEIETPTGISKKFFLLNVCNRIENALDKENCIYEIALFKEEGQENSIAAPGRFKRLLFKEGCMGEAHLGRMYENMYRVMVSETLVRAFNDAGIYGFNTEIFEDRVNGWFKSNYMPDGKTLKI